MKYVNPPTFSTSDVATFNGAAIDASQLFSCSFHFYFTDTDAAGTIKLQASNDPCPPGNGPSGFTPTNWIDIPSATATVAGGASKLIALTAMNYRWIRYVWTQTTPGSGLLKANLFGTSV